MQAKASDPPSPPALHPLLRRARQILPWTVAGLLAVIGWLVLHRQLASLDHDELMVALSSTSWSALAVALLLTIANYICLVGYDLTGLHWIDPKVPRRAGVLAGIIGFAFSNTISFTALSGGAVRYRIYTAAGMRPMDVARIVVFVASSFMIGVSAVGSVGLLLAPWRAATAFHVADWVVQAVALVIATALLLLIVAAALLRNGIQFRGRTIHLPSPGILILQLVISSLDVLLSASVLYVLLPADTGIGLGAFLGVYSAAIVLGLASHVPGGLGVFDGIVLAALSGHAPLEALAGALILYRVIYYLLPLAFGALLFLVHELTDRRHRLVFLLRHPRIGAAYRLLRSQAPRIGAVLAVTAGAILLASGSLPATPGRVRVVAHLVTLPVVEVSHVLASVAGLGLVLVGYGLFRRIDSAWLLAQALLSAGIILSLLKGFDYEEATLLVGLMGLLWLARGEFYRRGRLTDLRLTPGWLLAAAAAIGGATWLTLFSYEHVEYRDSLWWHFAVHADAPRSLRALVVTAAALLAIGLRQMMRPVAAKLTGPLLADMQDVRRILTTSPRTEGWLVLPGDKALLFSEDRRAFLMYAVRGGNWIMLGDPVGPRDAWPALVWQLREKADRHGARMAAYQVRPDSLPVYIDVGLMPVKIGEEARIPLTGFSVEGPERRDLRYALRRGEKDGLRFALVPPDGVPAILDEMRAVSDAWLDHRRAREKGFSVGFFDDDYMRSCTQAVVWENDRMVAFANLWTGARAPGLDAELSIDLMRHRDSRSAVVMDFLFAKLMLWGAAEGFAWFNLGMAPLSGLSGRPLAPLWQRIGAFLFARGEPFYGFRGLRSYKEKFRPVWEPRYLCCHGGLAPATVLADVAALVSGGLDGVIRK